MTGQQCTFFTTFPPFFLMHQFMIHIYIYIILFLTSNPPPAFKPQILRSLQRFKRPAGKMLVSKDFLAFSHLADNSTSNCSLRNFATCGQFLLCAGNQALIKAAFLRIKSWWLGWSPHMLCFCELLILYLLPVLLFFRFDFWVFDFVVLSFFVLFCWWAFFSFWFYNFFLSVCKFIHGKNCLSCFCLEHLIFLTLTWAKASLIGSRPGSQAGTGPTFA